MITLAEAAQATAGHWMRQPFPESTPLAGAAFDTRTVGAAQIFFALRGETSDGHQYVGRLAGSAVKLLVVHQDLVPEGYTGAVLRVEDTLRALADMARFLVRKFRPRVVAITGSYGKTTAKEVVAHVLAGQRRVLKSPGTLNNEIGVPITLLGLDGTQDTCVLEFSARKIGDVDYLGRIAPPDVAVLLAVGHAHIGIFGSRENIYRAKGEIFQHLRPGGLAIVNAEDPRLAELAAGHRLATFGKAAGDYHAADVHSDEQGRQGFTGIHGEDRLPLRSGIPGPHGHAAVLVAWAIARELGVPDAEVSRRASMTPETMGRSKLVVTPRGATLIDDTYNASPETVINLIDTLAALKPPRKILVLGHLSELEAGLGQSAEMIGAHLRPPLSECYIYAPVTPEFPRLLERHAQGVQVKRFESQAALIAALRDLDGPGVALGIKGARSAHMERTVQGLLGTAVACTLNACGLLKHCTDCDALSRHG
jgi:UDP-N-acetylmuramoyl-tripeptide--D-alanyl-D-alanine ligase